MNTVNSVQWDVLLDSNKRAMATVTNWATGSLSTTEAMSKFSGTKFAGPFRHLVRSNGTEYGRNLARKALRYRAVTV